MQTDLLKSPWRRFLLLNSFFIGYMIVLSSTSRSLDDKPDHAIGFPERSRLLVVLAVAAIALRCASCPRLVALTILLLAVRSPTVATSVCSSGLFCKGVYQKVCLGVELLVLRHRGIILNLESHWVPENYLLFCVLPLFQVLWIVKATCTLTTLSTDFSIRETLAIHLEALRSFAIASVNGTANFCVSGYKRGILGFLVGILPFT
jgi:hypothetical protein